MGKIKQGILGGFSGKVGGVVGSSWKGIAVMKSLPLTVTNPKTAAQVAARGKMSFVSKFASSILATICQPLWNRFASQKSGYNAFCAANIELFTTMYPATPADLVISSGKMAATSVASTDVDGSEILVTWDDDSGEGFKLGTDLAYLLAFDAAMDSLVLLTSAGDNVRTDGEATIDASDLDTLVGAHVYLCFLRADGTVVSDTAHAVVTA